MRRWRVSQLAGRVVEAVGLMVAQLVELRWRRRGNGRGQAFGDIGDVVAGDVMLDAATQGLQEGIDAVDFGLELKAEADAAAGLLPLEIDTCPVVAGAPGAGGLGAGLGGETRSNSKPARC